MQQIDEKILDAFNSYIVSIVQTEVRKALDKLSLETYRNVEVVSVVASGDKDNTEVTNK